MASGLIHNKDLSVKRISLGAIQSLTGGSVFALNFTDNSILGNIYGCLGFSLENRSLGPKLGIEAIYTTSSNTITIAGYCNTSCAIPATAYVNALVRGQ